MNETLKIEISNKFKNTSLGFLRIKKNLNILDFSDTKVEQYLKEIILTTPLEDIEKKGKNYYFKSFKYNTILTINAYSYTIITAKMILK